MHNQAIMYFDYWDLISEKDCTDYFALWVPHMELNLQTQKKEPV